MTKITYRYTYRGEEREKVETLDAVLNRLLTAKTDVLDWTKQPKLLFAKGEKGCYTGLVTVELQLRNITPNELTKIRETLKQLGQVALVFVDDVREVLTVVSAYTLPDGTLPSDANELRLFHAQAYMQETLSIKGLTELNIVHGSESIDYKITLRRDKDAWLNDNIRPQLLAQPMRTVDESALRRMVSQELPGRYDTTYFKLLPGYDAHEMMMEKFQKCLALVSDSSAEELDLYLTELAEHCYANGINEEFAIKRLLVSRHFRDKEVLVRDCFDNVYTDDRRRARESVVSKQQVVSNMLIDYLPRRYDFRCNELSGSVEYREDGMYLFDWQPVTKTVINTITLELQRLGMPLWDKDVKRYLESGFVKRYNPLTDYLYTTMGKWDGKDRIAELAARVPNGNPHWAELFHRWMLSAISQWSGRNTDYGSTVVPLLVGAQGDGKSTFCRFLLPPELRQFYTDRLDFTSKKDAERALSAFALINIDEYDSISKSQTAFLKHILQKTNIMGRDPYAISFSDHKRYAAFIATTNSPTPLLDPTGSRRYLCIRTTGKIDNSTPIDYEQVYGQLMTELFNGERAYFDSADEAYIQDQNMDFQTTDVLQEAFCAMFSKPENEAQGEWLPYIEIVKRMRKYTKGIAENRATISNLGRMLIKFGFKTKRSAKGRMVLVKETLV